MTTITLEKAQQDLPALIKRVLSGEDIVIGEQDTAVRLTPVTTAPSQQAAELVRKSYRGRGAFKGQLVVGPTPDHVGVRFSFHGRPLSTRPTVAAVPVCRRE